MAKYIDAEKIKFMGDVSDDDEGNVFVALEDVKRAIAQTPDADVVEVVMCGKCKQNIDGFCYKGISSLGYKKVEDDHFCSYGERKDKTK